MYKIILMFDCNSLFFCIYFIINMHDNYLTLFCGMDVYFKSMFIVLTDSINVFSVMENYSYINEFLIAPVI